MKTFYFPPYDFSKVGHKDLLNKLKEECREVEDAVYEYENSLYADVNRLNLLEELGDVIHCAETIMRYYNVDYSELGDIVEFVTLKNKLRGYYGKDTRTSAQKNSVQS